MIRILIAVEVNQDESADFLEAFNFFMKTKAPNSKLRVIIEKEMS